MGRKRQKSSSEDKSSIVGTYEISTGTAEVVADDFHDDGYILNINGVPSSHIVLGQPDLLDFEYMRWIAAAIEVLNQVDPGSLRVTHLGGAGCSLARYFAHLWPQSRHTVVELDAKLGELVRELFDIPRAPTVKIRPGDARAVTDSFQPASRDIIIRDVFSGATTPRSLTTVEFFTAAHNALAPGGLYVANCGDYPDLTGVRSEIAGMAEVFNHLAVIADPAMLKGRRYGNMILIGSDTPLPSDGSIEHSHIAKRILAGAVPAQYRDEPWARKLAGTPDQALRDSRS